MPEARPLPAFFRPRCEEGRDAHEACSAERATAAVSSRLGARLIWPLVPPHCSLEVVDAARAATRTRTHRDAFASVGWPVEWSVASAVHRGVPGRGGPR